MGVFLFLVLVASYFLYQWVGAVYVSQPRENHPAIFWNPVAATALTILPFAGFILVAICGFIYTSAGWYYLAGSIISWLLPMLKNRSAI